jgi:hypothetical protein
MQFGLVRGADEIDRLQSDHGSMNIQFCQILERAQAYIIILNNILCIKNICTGGIENVTVKY